MKDMGESTLYLMKCQLTLTRIEPIAIARLHPKQPSMVCLREAAFWAQGYVGNLEPSFGREEVDRTEIVYPSFKEENMSWKYSSRSAIE